MAKVKMSPRPRGEVLMACSPYVHVLSEKERENRCDSCFSCNDQLLKCSRCTVVWYCNVTCQAEDWPLHKIECRCLRQVAPHVPTESARLMFRLILRHRKGDHKKVKEKQGNTERCFDDLMSHVESIREDHERMQQFAAMCHTLKKFAGDELDLPSTPELLSMFGKMIINSFSICDGEMNAIGVGIYLRASMLDHRCRPNAVVTFMGTEAVVRSIGGKSGSGKEVFISYIDQLATTEERENSLQQLYFFTCHCDMCTSPELDRIMLSIRCPNRCDAPIIKQDDGDYETCGQCGFSNFDQAFIKKIDSAISESKETLEQIKELKKLNDAAGILAACEECFGYQGSLLHPVNVFRVRVLDKALDACMELQHWQRALGYGMETIEPYRRLYPTYHPNVGLQLMKVGKLQLYMQLHQDALRALHQADGIVKVTHGSKHPLALELRSLICQCQEELRAQLAD